MDVTTVWSVLLAAWLASGIPACIAIQHGQNLIWAQTPALRVTVSRLVGIEGDPEVWVPPQKPSVKHISAPHYGWEFKALGFSYRRQMLVWSESMNKKIQALILNGSTETIDVFTGTSPEVNGVAVDWVSSNVYWTDALYNWVMMAPLRPYTQDRVFRIVLQTGLDNPHGLAVHPEYNWLLLSDWGVRPRIEMMDLLGKGRRVLVDTDMLEPRGLALDMAKLVLYWVDSAKDTVESVNLKGFNLHRTVIKKDPGTTFFDLAVFKSYLFVTEQSRGLLRVVRQDALNDSISFILGNIPHGIVMYDDDQQPGDSEACDDFGCDHMCIEEEHTGPMCLCGEGYDMMDDMKTCVLEKQFLHPSHLYAIGMSICMYPANIADMSLDNVSLTSQCFLSDRYGYLALTFDAAENILYYSGNYTNTISALPLETGAKAKGVASGTGVVRGMALDWVVGILYWTDSTNGYIKMSRKDGRFQRVLFEEDVNNPLGIAVHPGRGKIYWTDIGHQPDVLPKIESANMDGSERQVVVRDDLGQPNHLFIDYHADKLYWADSVLHHVREMDLNTNGWKVFYQNPKVKFYGISLYKDYILWTDTEDMNGIHIARLDKQRKVRGIIHPKYGVAADLITFDPLLQPDLSSPCNNSQQCQQLCLPRGDTNFTCSCGLGFKLKDQAKCVVENITGDNFIIVNDAYQRNMYQLDARNGVISAMSPGESHEPIAIDLASYPSNTIYWSDNTAKVIRRKRLGNYDPHTFLDMPEVSVVDGIALDSENCLLFYTDTGRDVIKAANTLGGPVRQVTVISDGLDEPRDIVVSPKDGVIYWSDWGVNASISEARMDGQQRQVIVSFNHSSWPNGLAIDTKGRALYWADAKNNDIGLLHLDTRQQRILLREPAAHYFGLFVMGDFLYVTDWRRNYVARMHKLGGELMRFGESKFTKLYGITGYNSTDTPRGGTGVCANQTRCDNSSLCIPLSATKFVCACIDGYRRFRHICQKVVDTPTNSTTPTSSLTTTHSPATGYTHDDNDTALPTYTSAHFNDLTTGTPGKRVTGNDDHNGNDTDHLLEVTTLPSGSGSGGRNHGDDDDGKTNESGDGGGRGSSGKGHTDRKDHGTKDGGGRLPPKSAESRISSKAETGIVVASVLVGVALLVAAVLAAVFYLKRRRGYNVPHTRLTEDGKRPKPQSGPDALRVTYARHNSSDSVHVDDGFENPTYGVTMAMLAAHSATDGTSDNGPPAI